MKSILSQLKTAVSEALIKAFGEDLKDTDPLVVPASNPKFGDYQSNVALSLTKILKKNPEKLPKVLLKL